MADHPPREAVPNLRSIVPELTLMLRHKQLLRDGTLAVAIFHAFSYLLLYALRPHGDRAASCAQTFMLL